MSVRIRLMLVTCGIVLFLTSALSIGSYVLTSRFLLNEVDQTLTGRVTLISEMLQTNSGSLHGMTSQRNPLTNALFPMRFDTVTQVVSRQGDILVGFGEVELPVSDGVLNIANDPQSQRAHAIVNIENEKYRMLVVPLVNGGALQIAMDIGNIERAKLAIRRGGMFLAVVGMAVAAAFAWFFSTRITRPIEQLASSVKHIAKTLELNATFNPGGDREIRQLTASFVSMVNALKISRDQQRQLVQDASHELRTPLTSLRANSEILQRDDIDAKTKSEVLRDIRHEVDELVSLTAEISALATDQKSSEMLISISLGQFVDEVVARAKRRYLREIEFVEHQSATVKVRESQLDRALSNLLENAVKFSPVEGAIEVKVFGKRIEVADHGYGISDDDKPRVFDRFFRATATRSLPGSGLGLAIVKQFADDHGAQIGVVDTPGGGTTVFIEFAE